MGIVALSSLVVPFNFLHSAFLEDGEPAHVASETNDSIVVSSLSVPDWEMGESCSSNIAFIPGVDFRHAVINGWEAPIVNHSGGITLAPFP